jgi:hypothetical protein
VERRVDPTAIENDELHARAAALVRSDPVTTIARASELLERWIARLGGEPPPAWREWRVALRMLDAPELARFLESRTPRAQRMKISSPFLVVALENVA